MNNVVTRKIIHNTLILSMPRSQSSRVYECFRESGKYEHCFDEPGFEDAWFSHPLRIPEWSQHSLDQTTQALRNGTGSVLIKMIPTYPWAPLTSYTVSAWRSCFQDVIYLKRPFEEVCVSFFVAWKRAEWRRTSHAKAADQMRYEANTDKACISTCLVNWHAFNIWEKIIPPTEVVNVGPELEAFLAYRRLSQSTYLPQQANGEYSRIIENYDELLRDIKQAAYFSEAFL